MSYIEHGRYYLVIQHGAGMRYVTDLPYPDCDEEELAVAKAASLEAHINKHKSKRAPLVKVFAVKMLRRTPPATTEPLAQSASPGTPDQAA